MFGMAVFGLVSRDIDGVVPAVLDEIHGRTACVVFGTMLCPLLLMARGHPQVERRAYHAHRNRLDYDWRRNDDARLREGTNVDPTIESRLANLDRDTNVGCHGGSTGQ